MERIRNVLKTKINNMPLATKILAILLAGITIMGGISFLVIEIVDSSYKKLLYQALSESISYSSKEIAGYMNDMEKLSMMLLSDGNIQEGLAIMKDKPVHSLAYMNSVQQVNSSVGGYYQSFSDGILRYITLYGESSTAYTNILRADEVPYEIQKELRVKAEEKEGGICWFADYINDYGMFLGRNIKKIHSVRLDPLGTVLLNFDMDALISAVTAFDNHYEEAAYVIRFGENILYHTDNLNVEEAERVGSGDNKEYQILKLKEHNYFTAHGEIPGYGWDYYCLVSYDSIAEKLFYARMICFFIILADMLMIIIFSKKLIGSLMAHVSRLKEKMQQFAEDNTRMPQVGYDYTERADELGVLHRQFDEMSGTIISLIRENYINELLKKEASLKALENQINPHFLYNTLGSVKWRAKAAGEQDISDMVDALGGLLRVTLSRKDDKDFTLGKEMEVVKSYITIQKFRYEERLNFENRIDKSYYNVKLPKLTVQPLIENAVYYGIEMNVEDCNVILSAGKVGELLHIYVKNTGSEIEPELLKQLEEGIIKPHGNGIGLVNINKRIKICYGEKYGLQFYNENGYAVAEMTIPLQTVEGPDEEGKNVEGNHC